MMHRRALIGAVVVWVLAIGVGLKLITDDKTAPGAQAGAPAMWPRGSRIAPVPGRHTLVMFVHPKCPCTRASMSELNVIMNAERAHTSAFVVFLRPEGVDESWERTDTWDAAGNVPNAVRLVDRDGVEADRFGAQTSGHVVLYDPMGRLLYSGGITDSRGHVGDNMGRRSVLELLAAGAASPGTHAVFGCALHDPG